MRLQNNKHHDERRASQQPGCRQRTQLMKNDNIDNSINKGLILNLLKCQEFGNM